MDNYGLVASPGEANHSGVGIGVGLRADAAGVHVNRVFHGGPAHLCGRVARTPANGRDAGLRRRATLAPAAP